MMADAATHSRAGLSAKEKQFPCPDCQRRFSRREHMHRHRLLHTHTPRPHQCPDCLRSFTRQDALHRHRSMHSPSEPLLTDEILSNPRRRAAVFRSRQACARCSRLKLKCDGDSPCQRCHSKPEGTCKYPLLSKDDSSVSVRRLRQQSGQEADQGDEDELAQTDNDIQQSPATIDPSALVVGETPAMRGMPAEVVFSLPPDTADEQHSSTFIRSADRRAVMIRDLALEHSQRDEQMLYDLHNSISAIQAASPSDIMPASDFDWLFVAQTPTSRLEQGAEGSLEWPPLFFASNQHPEQPRLSMSLAGFQRPVVASMTPDTPLDLLSSTALSAADTMPDQASNMRSSRPRVPLEPRDLRAPSRRNSLPGGGTAKDWPNSWYPQPADMLLNADFFENASEEVLMAENSFQVTAFDERAKERLLGICESAELPENEAQKVHDMLSRVNVPTYNILVQLFFERFQTSNPFVHRETFSPARCNPLLLAAVCAFGTFYSRIPKSRNLGNVLIELVDRAIVLTTTRNNLHARSLSSIQAFVLISIYYGNAGNRRFLEHAEASRGAVATMVRRCRLLDSVDEPAFGAATEDGDADKEERWKAWLQWETGRRTGWACFVADMELSSTWSLPTSFLLAELKTMLPSSEDLWEAPNAEVWATIHRSSVPSPSLDCLHEAFGQSSLAAELQHMDLFQSLILAQSLSLVGQSIMEMMMHGKLARLVEPVRHEFFSSVEASLDFRQHHGGNSVHRTKLATFKVILCFLALRTHVNMSDLQALCGRRGDSEAKRARERLNAMFTASPVLSHAIARYCADIVHVVHTHTIHVASLSTTTFYAVVFLYAYSSAQSRNQGQDSASGSTRLSHIVVEKVGDLASPHFPPRLLTTMSHFLLTQLANRTWPMCKNLGSILSDMATREASPAG